MKLVAYSTMDPAGVNIVKVLRERGLPSGCEFLEVRDESVRDLESLGGDDVELVVVASRHKSESGKPTLTCHVTGNYGSADLGGREGELGIAPALYLREALLSLKRNEIHGFTVSLEVTHHGPSVVGAPLLFMEVGSSEGQWSNVGACTAVAESIKEVLSTEPQASPSSIGFGGPHYAPNFTRVMLEKEVALGHIMPKYYTSDATSSIVKQMISKTIPKPEYALLDWKGLKSEDKQKIKGILDEIGLPYKKTSEV